MQLFSNKMSENATIYAIRSDVHGRIDLSRQQFQEARKYAGLFDLGDVEAKYIGRFHPLRKGQQKDEQTMDAIVRNAVDTDGTLTSVAQKAIQDTLVSVELMSSHLRENLGDRLFYRALAGNAAESWIKVFEAISNPDQQDNLKHLFDEFDLISDCSLEEIGSSVMVYLPWKASPTTLETTLANLDGYDPARVVVLSHDYLTRPSLKPEWISGIKPMQNEEQAIKTLDNLSQRDCEIVLCYGHIGFEYEPAEVKFRYLEKDMTAYHTDEKGGKLLELKL